MRGRSHTWPKGICSATGPKMPLDGARVLELAREHGERANEALALCVLGDIAAHSDPVDVLKAEAHYRNARVLAEELGMRPLVAHCHLGLGKLYRRTGKRQEAQEHLATATTMYREMGMRFYLEQAQAELASDRPIVGQTDGP